MSNENLISESKEVAKYIPESAAARVYRLIEALNEAERKLESVVAELSAVLTDRAVILEDLDTTCFEIGMMRGEKSESYPVPVVVNHDAFLAEVRASAIEHAASERWGSGYVFHELNNFAAKLRQEAK